MNEIKCPKCNTTFKIDENEYKSIVETIRNKEFNEEIKRVENNYKIQEENNIKLKEASLNEIYNKELNNKIREIDLLKNELNNKENNIKNELELKYNEIINKKILEINELENKLKLKDNEKTIEIQKAITEKDNIINNLNNNIKLNEQSYELKEKNIKETYEFKLKEKEELISYYKDFKTRLSTKMIGESLEQHCSNEFNALRPIFNNAYFEKDNEIKDGTKGDFIFRNYDNEGTEIVSILFEMKNEADTTQSKHKNEDFLNKLDKDRKNKNCEYAVLVSLLESDNELYNNGIVDKSHLYEKMYVIRPQFFIPIITLINSLANNSLKYKKEYELIKKQNIDITHFEENLENFKEGFSRNYNLASKKFKGVIDDIDKAIKNLQDVKDGLLGSENNLRLANNKLEDLTIKKLTHNNPTIKELFENIKNDN